MSAELVATEDDGGGSDDVLSCSGSEDVCLFLDGSTGNLDYNSSIDVYGFAVHLSNDFSTINSGNGSSSQRCPY